MNYVLVNADNEVVQYPFQLSALKKLHPNVSFPGVIPEETLRAYNVFPVTAAKIPSHNTETHKIIKSVEYADGQWREIASTVALPIERLSAMMSAKAQVELKETNDIILSFVERNAKVPEAWVDYRYFLRTIENQSGFPDRLNWPERPLV